MIDSTSVKSVRNWIKPTLQEENSSCKFGILQGIKVLCAGLTTGTGNDKLMTLRKSTCTIKIIPVTVFRILAFAFAELVDNALAATADNEGPRKIEIRLVRLGILQYY